MVIQVKRETNQQPIKVAHADCLKYKMILKLKIGLIMITVHHYHPSVSIEIIPEMSVVYA